MPVEHGVAKPRTPGPLPEAAGNTTSPLVRTGLMAAGRVRWIRLPEFLGMRLAGPGAHGVGAGVPLAAQGGLQVEKTT